MKQAKPNLDELLKELGKLNLPDSLQLTPHEMIINLPKMIESHTSYLKAHKGNKAYLPYYDRLLMVLNILKDN